MDTKTYLPVYQVTASQRDKSQIGSKATLIILLLIAFVLGLSLFVFSQQSLRLDEAQSIWQSSHSLSGVVDTISRDVHVPLYGIILHFWQMFVGTSVQTGRLLSLGFFLLSIPAMYLLGRTAYNKNIALFATTLLAISPFLNWYGSEIRMYSLFLLLTILNQFLFIKIYLSGKDRRSNKKPLTFIWIGFALVSALGIYTHYFFWLVLFTEAIFFWLNRSVFPKAALRNFFLVALFLILAIAPWAYFVNANPEAGTQTPVLSKPTSSDFFNLFSQFFFGFQEDHLNTAIISLWPITVLLAFLALKKRKQFRLPAAFFLLSAIVPILAALAASFTIRPVFLARYLILSVPALYIFISWLISTYPPKIAFGIKAVLVIFMAFTLYQQVVSANTPVKENFEAASLYLNDNAKATDVIILSAPFTLYPVEYYYSGPAKITTLPIWNPYTVGSIPPFSKDKLPDEASSLLKNHQTAWVLLSYDQGYQNDIFLYFETHFHRVNQINFSPKLDLYEYKIEYREN